VTEKAKRNSSPIGVGQAADRIAALRRSIRAEAERAADEAREKVLGRLREREQAILNRVPLDLCGKVGVLVEALEETEPRAPLSAAEVADEDQPLLSDSPAVRSELRFRQDAIPAWADEPPKAAAPLVVDERPEAKRARR
jgi:hypothetical protein